MANTSTTRVNVDVRELTRNFNDHIPVDHVAMVIEQGKIFDLIDPNGAGKSPRHRLRS